jgi:hypothetical protein
MMDPTREQKMAAIEHVVFSYTYLLSAGHYSLFGAAPWRTHAEAAFQAQYRDMADFLLGEPGAGRIVAADYLVPGTAREWDLSTWRADWRDVIGTRLDGLVYDRLTTPPWTSHKCVPKLEAEIREAWRLFYESLTDADFRREFVRQVEIRRRELVPFHVRVELLYV